MADAAAASSANVDTKPEVDATRPAEGDVAMTDATADPPASEGATDSAKKEEKDEVADPTASAAPETSPATAAPDADPTSTSADVATSDKVEAQESAEASKKDNKKRKSISSVPEHKSKKLSRKKSMPNLHLNAQPGELWWAHMRGHPQWPAIICDEEMLPDSLLSKRPVSAARADGSYREDFLEGGKNARDRRYPIMFLGTNEFAWHVNTDLSPLDITKVQEIVEKGERGKLSNSLWEAHKVAAEENDLQHFKDMLNAHAAALRVDEEALAKEEEEPTPPKSAKKEKAKKKAKEPAKEDDEDVEMPDAEEEEPKKAKASAKKRKKGEESEGEGKTPKTTKIKLNVSKTPTEPSATKAKKSKAKKPAKAEEPEEEVKQDEDSHLTEAEKKDKRQKSVLYLRHRLQKGFLSRDSPPKEEEMVVMNTHFGSLEHFLDLEPEIIKATKIHKVLKAIIKLASIPKDEEFKFKERSNTLLGHWNKALAADVDTTTGADADEPKTNGVAHEEKVNGSKSPAEEETKETPAPAATANGDVSGDKKEAEPAAAEVADASEPAKPTEEPATVSSTA